MIPNLAVDEGAELVRTMQPFVIGSSIDLDNDFGIGASIELERPVAHALVLVHEHDQALCHKAPIAAPIPVREALAQLFDGDGCVRIAVLAQKINRPFKRIPLPDGIRKPDAEFAVAPVEHFDRRARKPGRCRQKCGRISVVFGGRERHGAQRRQGCRP